MRTTPAENTDTMTEQRKEAERRGWRLSIWRVEHEQGEGVASRRISGKDEDWSRNGRGLAMADPSRPLTTPPQPGKEQRPWADSGAGARTWTTAKSSAMGRERKELSAMEGTELELELGAAMERGFGRSRKEEVGGKAKQRKPAMEG